MAETIRTLDDLVRSGKVRYVGACNLAGWEMQRMVDLSDKLGCNPFVTLQVRKSMAIWQWQMPVPLWPPVFSVSQDRVPMVEFWVECNNSKIYILLQENSHPFQFWWLDWWWQELSMESGRLGSHFCALNWSFLTDRVQLSDVLVPPSFLHFLFYVLFFAVMLQSGCEILRAGSVHCLQEWRTWCSTLGSTERVKMHLFSLKYRNLWWKFFDPCYQHNSFLFSVGFWQANWREVTKLQKDPAWNKEPSPK